MSISKSVFKGFYSLVISWFMFSSHAVLADVSCDNGLSCTQTIKLNPGWNSIFVQVKPDADATAVVFADLLDGENSQISSVWTWLAHRAKIDFIQDPDSEKLLSQEGWLRYFPEQTKNSFLTNLYAIQANRAYLVKYEGTEAATISITGQPVMPRAAWQSSSFNHLGFHVDPQNLPTFYDYFSASPAHKDQPIYQLVNNEWSLVNALNTIIQPDVAYWVFSKTGSDYFGPIELTLPQVDRLEYGTVLEQFTVRVKNKIDDSQSISVQILGNAPGMYYPNPDAVSADTWLALPNPLTINVATGGESRLPLGIRRADFALSEFDHVLQITSAVGSRWLIPVTAKAPALNSLWVGSVTINGVSQVQNYQRNCIDTAIKTAYETYDVQGQSITLEYDDYEPNIDTAGTGYDLCRRADGSPIADDGDTVTPVKEGGEFSFRVIVHREGTTIRLLKDVIQMWKPAVVAEDGSVTEAGRYVLLTDDTLIPNYEGVSLRDGEVVGRRISSMAYDFPGNSHPMSGELETTLETTLILADNSPTNPFKHQYHSDHKDRRNNSGEFIAGGGYEITRQMTFESVDSATLPPEQKVESLAIDREAIQGNYTEIISGLHKTPIILEGTYILRHVSYVTTLNN